MTTAKELLVTLSELELDHLINSTDEFMKTGTAANTVFRSFAEQVIENSPLASDLLMVALSIYHYATGVYRERLEICEFYFSDGSR
jgi:hypothetical protein